MKKSDRPRLSLFLDEETKRTIEEWAYLTKIPQQQLLEQATLGFLSRHHVVNGELLEKTDENFKKTENLKPRPKNREKMKSEGDLIDKCHTLLNSIFNSGQPVFETAITACLEGVSLAAGATKDHGVSGNREAVKARASGLIEDANSLIEQSKEAGHGDRQASERNIKKPA